MEKVEILMNWSCNQNCIFCSTADNFEKGSVKPWEEIKEIVNEAAEEADMISLSGGEPTINKNIFRTVECAHEKGFEEIEVQSNGMMFQDEDYLDKLLDLGVTRILVSIHSHKPPKHDFMTRVKGSFEKAMEGLKNIKERDVELRYSTVVNKYNYKDLKELAEFLYKNFGSVFSFHFNYIMPQGNAKEGFEKLAPKLCETKPYLQEAVKFLKEKDQRPWLHNIYPCIMGKDYEPYMTEIILTQTNLYGPDFECEIDEKRHTFRKKPESCEKCQYSEVCVGPPEKYLKVFGEKEFRPLEGQKKSRNDIKSQDYSSRD